MTTQLTLEQIAEATAITNSIGSTASPRYAFVSCVSTGGDTVCQVTVTVLDGELAGSAEYGRVKAEKAWLVPGYEDRFRITLLEANVNVQKRLNIGGNK